MYELRVTRPALKDIASLPKEYAELVSRHIDELENNPRPLALSDFKGEQILASVSVSTAFSMRLTMNDTS
jgi:mRNA-degrading endonuclease RelE of RelBE toxin-antitoxin system